MGDGPGVSESVWNILKSLTCLTEMGSWGASTAQNSPIGHSAPHIYVMCTHPPTSPSLLDPRRHGGCGQVRQGVSKTRSVLDPAPGSGISGVGGQSGSARRSVNQGGGSCGPDALARVGGPKRTRCGQFCGTRRTRACARRCDAVSLVGEACGQRGTDHGIQ